MQSILEPHLEESIKERLAKLTIDNNRQFGTLTVDQMLGHAAAQINLASGLRKNLSDNSTFISRNFIRHLFLLKQNFPMGIVTKAPMPAVIEGTTNETLELLKQEILDQIRYFKSLPTNHKTLHPLLGICSKKQWAKMIYGHLDHHLRQFSA